MRWTGIPGLGPAGARRIEAFFAQAPGPHGTCPGAGHGQSVAGPAPLGTAGGARGRRRFERSLQGASSNDYEAVQAWLSLHESAATQKAYRKEAERLILWAVVERRRALSSLTTEDAIAFRSFLHHPTPRARWVGTAQPRSSPLWRPFARNQSARSVAYALSVLNALYRWIIEQRYLLANPFASVKVRAARPAQLDTACAFTEHEWKLFRIVADGLEWSYGWRAPAAQRLRFVLDIAYSTGLRISDLVEPKLGAIGSDDRGDVWLRVVGKGHKVVLPPLARAGLDRYLMQRGLPVTPSK